MKKIVVVLLACMLGLVAQVHGDIVLQKAKTGGHALGIRLGMVASELDNIYTWRIDTAQNQRVALLNFNGAVCYISTQIEIVKSIHIQVFCTTDEHIKQVESLVPKSKAKKIGSDYYYHEGVVYSAPTPRGQISNISISYQ